MGHSTGGLLAQIIADRGFVRGDGGDRSRTVPRCAAAADPSVAGREPGASKPLEPGPCHRSHPRPVQVRLGERPRRRGGGAAVRDLPRGGAGRGADADGQRQSEPAHRGKARPQEPGSRAAADHRRREGPHGAVGDRKRIVQAPATATRRSPRSKRSPTAVTRSPSTAAGARWPNRALAFVKRFAGGRPKATTPSTNPKGASREAHHRSRPRRLRRVLELGRRHRSAARRRPSGDRRRQPAAQPRLGRRGRRRRRPCGRRAGRARRPLLRRRGDLQRPGRRRRNRRARLRLRLRAGAR